MPWEDPSAVAGREQAGRSSPVGWEGGLWGGEGVVVLLLEGWVDKYCKS